MYIFDMWLACESNVDISETVGLSPQRVGEIIAGKYGFGQVSDSVVFRDFESEDSHRKNYDIWNFGKATNEVRHFGNIPPEIFQDKERAQE